MASVTEFAAQLAQERESIHALVRAELGASALPPPALPATTPSTGKRRRAAKAAFGDDSDAEGAPRSFSLPEVRRRSARVAQLPPVAYSEDAAQGVVNVQHEQPADGEASAEIDVAPVWRSAASLRDAADAAPGSLAATRADVPWMQSHLLGLLVCPESLSPGPTARACTCDAACTRARVCTRLEALPPKARVMAAATGTGSLPKFSRMSGIQQWQNAVFLFMNVCEAGHAAAPGHECNAFAARRDDAGRMLLRVTWFAQPTQSEASPVIQRLIHHASGCMYPPASSEQSTGDGTDRVLLPPAAVCLSARLEGQPYIWAGTLKYVRHNARVRPMKFVWELQDADALMDRRGRDEPTALERMLAVATRDPSL